MRLRPGPAAVGYNSLHVVVLSPTDCNRILPYIYLGQGGYNISQGSFRYAAGLFKPFSSFRINASSKGFTAFTR